MLEKLAKVDNFVPAMVTKFRANHNDYSCRTCGDRVLKSDRWQHDQDHRRQTEEKQETDEVLHNHADSIDILLSEVERIKAWIQIPGEDDNGSNGDRQKAG